MDVYTCTDHDGHSIGVASVVVANSEPEARGLLKAALHEHGLDENKPFMLRRINTETPRAFVLQDGDH